ncbi:MAG: hypothetical protein MZV70_49420 [Desulfobacterales bacterium]|nr:hypothetical protein [Desulfobacterales bacterium]
MVKFTVLALAIGAAAGFAAVAGHPAVMCGLSFFSALDFSAPAEAGLDAQRIVFPRDAVPGAEPMSITAVRFPAEAVGAGGMSDAELLDYVKTAFLATTAAGGPLERTFLGRKSAGEAFAKTIPVPSRAEIYVVALQNGDKVVFGFVFSAEFAARAEQTIAEVAASLGEQEAVKGTAESE